MWDIVSNQLNKIYNVGLVVFGYFTAIILHIVPLSEKILPELMLLKKWAGTVGLCSTLGS